MTEAQTLFETIKIILAYGLFAIAFSVGVAAASEWWID